MAPYLSIVVTTRNDDHGGDLLRRTQTFVNCLLAQCRRHALPAELIIVEWNPPGDRPPLVRALRWPAQEFCDVRIIEVPPELHRRYAHWKALPLYQMIGKNVGIRRARGEFILATNIDILFSDELMQFLADRRLERGKMYRIDRYDVMPDVPVDAPVDGQLAYCRSHLIRVNARDGTFRMAQDGPGVLQGQEGPRVLQPNDIAEQDSGLSFQHGWYELETDAGQPFRWVNDDAELLIGPCQNAGRTLVLDLEPGPGVKLRPFSLEIHDESKAHVARVEVKRRSIVRLPVALSSVDPTRLRLRVEGGGTRIASDSRTLNFRVFRCLLDEGPRAANGQAASPTVTPGGSLGSRLALQLRMLREMIRNTPLESIAASSQQAEPAVEREIAPVHLHTNACGDFTLLAKEHWMDLRGYPEFDTYSLHIDSVLCWAAHHGGAREEVLKDPMRIYHIEHGLGSGWTPEGQEKLFERLKARGVPWLSYPILIRWALDMNRFGAPMIFNHEDWGMIAEKLKETSPDGTP